MASGTIIGAADEKRLFFDEQPDSHIKLTGFTIPRWKEACDLAKEAALRLPEATFIGWDFALTDSGWVMVEGNHTPLIIWQIAAGKGIREKFDEIERRTVYRKRVN